MLLPGSFSGKISSPSPDLGPEPKNLMSFAIFIKETATVLRLPCSSTKESLQARASNLFFAEVNLWLVKFEISLAIFSSKPI